jgi:oligoendopeptidase F
VIERWRGRVADSTLARRLDLHHRDFLQSRADPALVIALADAQTAVQDTVSAFRFRVGGEPQTLTGISEILTNESRRARRREAFLAYTQMADRNARAIVACMELNDRVGRQEGFGNGAEAGLALSSLTREQVLRDLDAFERATRPTLMAMVARAKRDLKLDAVQPWDLDYWLHLQETAGGDDAWPREPGLQRMNALMKDLGFAPDSLPIDTRIWDVPTGGITFPIRPPYESRLLTNPFTGSNFYETLFHEYGHCLNAVLTDRNLPAICLLGDETPMSEGLAECLGHFAYDAHWLERAAHFAPERAAALERVGKMQLLLWLRRTICLNAWFELTAYGNLHGDLDSLYAAAYRRFVGVPLPPGRFFAYRDGFATGPLYFQSYLYANMIAVQLREAMRAQFGVDDLTREPRVAGWLTATCFAPGGSVPWPEKIRRATGRPLGTEALARYLAGAMPAAK